MSKNARKKARKAARRNAMRSAAPRTLYFAYGSNLDVDGMCRRCPGAYRVGAATLKDWRLAFRGVADIEPSDTDVVLGAVWSCGPTDIDALDRYEGVAGGFYRRDYVDVDMRDGGTQNALVYVMDDVSPYDRCSMPSEHYLGSIARGYTAFGLDHNHLRAALKRTKALCEKKGVDRWEHDGRKRMRPAVPLPKRSERAHVIGRHRQAGAMPPRPASVDRTVRDYIMGGYIPSEEEALALGMSPAALADLELELREEGIRMRSDGVIEAVRVA